MAPIAEGTSSMIATQDGSWAIMALGISSLTCEKDH
jgi:hypothetical protein